MLLTGGLLWLLALYSPKTALWTMQRCSLSKAEYVHVKVALPASTTQYLYALFVLPHDILLNPHALVWERPQPHYLLCHIVTANLLVAGEWAP